MSNICSRCGHLINYSLMPLSSINKNHCHFCISEFNTLLKNLDKNREKSLADLESRLKVKHGEQA